MKLIERIRAALLVAGWECYLPATFRNDYIGCAALVFGLLLHFSSGSWLDWIVLIHAHVNAEHFIVAREVAQVVALHEHVRAKVCQQAKFARLAYFKDVIHQLTITVLKAAVAVAVK